jgi:large subunit ribosomal protein L31
MPDETESAAPAALSVVWRLLGSGNPRAAPVVIGEDARKSSSPVGTGRALVLRLKVYERRTVQGAHPDRVITNVRCVSCGHEFTTRSTRAELTLDVCSRCHPAYTGVAREVVRGSRIERFERRRARAAAA